MSRYIHKPCSSACFGWLNIHKEPRAGHNTAFHACLPTSNNVHTNTDGLACSTVPTNMMLVCQLSTQHTQPLHYVLCPTSSATTPLHTLKPVCKCQNSNSRTLKTHTSTHRASQDVVERVWQLEGKGCCLLSVQITELVPDQRHQGHVANLQ